MIKKAKRSNTWKLYVGKINTLTEEMVPDKICEEVTCSNPHIVNELEIQVTVVILSDIFITACPDGKRSCRDCFVYLYTGRNQIT